MREKLRVSPNVPWSATWRVPADLEEDLDREKGRQLGAADIRAANSIMRMPLKLKKRKKCLNVENSVVGGNKLNSTCSHSKPDCARTETERHHARGASKEAKLPRFSNACRYSSRHVRALPTIVCSFRPSSPAWRRGTVRSERSHGGPAARQSVATAIIFQALPPRHQPCPQPTTHPATPFAAPNPYAAIPGPRLREPRPQQPQLQRAHGAHTHSRSAWPASTTECSFSRTARSSTSLRRWGEALRRARGRARGRAHAPAVGGVPRGRV